MLISPAKAIGLYQVSKPTLYADMKSGKISFKKDNRGKRKLEISELERVYSKREESSEAKKSVTITKMGDTTSYENELEKKLLEQKIQFLEEQIKSKNEMIDQWIDAHNKAQKTADKITALIEDQTAVKQGRAGEQDKIYALEETINKLIASEELRRKQNDERRAKIIARRQAQEEKRKLAEEQQNQSKPWWVKLIG